MDDDENARYLTSYLCQRSGEWLIDCPAEIDREALEAVIKDYYANLL